MVFGFDWDSEKFWDSFLDVLKWKCLQYFAKMQFSCCCCCMLVMHSISLASCQWWLRWWNEERVKECKRSTQDNTKKCISNINATRTHEHGEHFIAKSLKTAIERGEWKMKKYTTQHSNYKKTNVIWTRMGKGLTEISNYYKKTFFFVRENQFALNCFARE